MSQFIVKNAAGRWLRNAASGAAFAAACALLVTLGVGCSKSPERAETPAPEQQSPPTATVSPAAVVAAAPMSPIEPCTLLTSEELQAVQGEPLSTTKATTHQVQGLAMYDCFFTLPTFSNSVSLSITQSGAGPDARDARQSWRDTLAAATAKAGPKVDPPKKIEGVGEEAFWTGNERVGALYVLSGPRYLRISVGGAGGPSSKIEKSRVLADAILKKL